MPGSDGYDELINSGNLAIADMAMKCEAVFAGHGHAVVSISGGSDSDVMLDVCERVRAVQPIEITYAWFDTGMEYKATRRHIDYLEERYGVDIERRRAVKTIPVSCHEHGQPFSSKHASEMIRRLQSIGFQWEDGTFDELYARYGHRQSSAFRWWCNDYMPGGRPGLFDIGRVRHLREFMMGNPPWFKISAKCCDFAKKNVSHRIEREREADLSLVGVRKAERGARAGHSKCFTHTCGIDVYRPLFWLSDDDKRAYVSAFGIRHSDCYAVWGLRRTGCAGCPFAHDRWHELGVIEQFEPNVARACKRVFRDAYEYQRMFDEFRETRNGVMRLW